MLGNSVSAVISSAMDRAGVPGTPHALRHWFGSALRAAGVDTLIIKELMGHDSLTTTAIYVHVGMDQQQAAVAALPDQWAGRRWLRYLPSNGEVRPRFAPEISRRQVPVHHRRVGLRFLTRRHPG